MAFNRLTTGERKRLQQGILTPQQATVISARAEARNPDGFWSTTWGQVIRAVGVAALNFIPGVGGVASQAAGAYDAQRAASLQRKAALDYSAALGSTAPRPLSPPLYSYGPAPWEPNYGSIGYPGYGGGTISVGGGSTTEPGFLDQVSEAVSGVSPWVWALVAGAVLLLLLFSRGGR